MPIARWMRTLTLAAGAALALAACAEPVPENALYERLVGLMEAEQKRKDMTDQVCPLVDQGALLRMYSEMQDVEGVMFSYHNEETYLIPEDTYQVSITIITGFAESMSLYIWINDSRNYCKSHFYTHAWI